MIKYKYILYNMVSNEYLQQTVMRIIKRYIDGVSVRYWVFVAHNKRQVLSQYLC